MGKRGRRYQHYQRKPRPRFSEPLSLSASPLAPHDLPVWRKESDLVSMIDRSQVAVITGNTGCGKTTQVPKMILEHWPNAMVIVTQPRRLAAISAAKRVAVEMRCAVGELVGYHVHGDRGYSHKTRILYVTVGLFIQELVGLQSSPPWSHIIVDEVHERSMEIDFALVLLKHLLARYQQTKLVLMSATIDSRIFSNYFSREEVGKVLGNISRDSEDSWSPSAPSRFAKDFDGPAPSLDTGSQLFKVQKLYLEAITDILSQCRSLPEGFSADCFSATNYTHSSLAVDISPDMYRFAAQVVYAQHRTECFVEETEAKGSFLVFLPGLHEINCMSEALGKAFDYCMDSVEVLVLHSAVPENEHFRVLEPVAPGMRRVVLSTNIAESSLTLGDVRFVLDFCYSKEVTYSARTFTESLDLVWCSRAGLKQRAGRAGRVANGIVFRLIPQTFRKSLQLYSSPEMRRCPLDKLILKAKQLNLGSSTAILGKAIEPPNSEDIRKTERFLRGIGALSSAGTLTWIGQVAADMPCNLNLTRLCLFGGAFGCMAQTVIIAAILSQDKPLFQSYTASMRARKHEWEVYQSKMKWAEGLDSDLLASYNAVEEWMQTFGKGVVGDDFTFHVRRFSPTLKERSWCTENHISPTVLRDVIIGTQELRRRLSYANIPSEILNSRVNLKSADRLHAVWAIKLAIAAAFVGRYLVSRYAEDRARKTPQTQQTVTIMGCADFVGEDDVSSMVKRYAKVENCEVQIGFNRAEIEFKDVASFRQMQFFLWCSNYSQRHRQGDFVVIKRTIRKENDLVNKQEVDDRTRDYYLRQVTKQESKRTKCFSLDAEQYENEVHQVEVACLPRPEHTHRLDFSDLKTYLDVTVEEDSLNSVWLEFDSRMERNHLLVACQYIVKGQQSPRTFAGQTTHFDPLPMLPQLLALCFESEVALVKDEQGERYGGVHFLDTDQVSDIDYEFRRRDLEEVNQVRCLLSQGLASPRALTDIAKSNLLPLLLGLLTRQRLRAVKGGVAWVNQAMDLIEAAQAPGRQQYLGPIAPLADVREDARQWDPDWESIRKEEISSQVQARRNLLADLDRRVRLIEMKEVELICAVCKSSIAFAKNVKCVGGDVYTFSPIYGSVLTVSLSPDHSPLGDKTFPSPPTKWVACTQSHILGWEDSTGAFLLFADSPVTVLMPTLTEVEFTAALFRDNAAELQTLLQQFLKRRKELKVDLTCQVCEVRLDSESDFVKHMFRDKTHKELLARLKSELQF